MTEEEIYEDSMFLCQRDMSSINNTVNPVPSIVWGIIFGIFVIVIALTFLIGFGTDYSLGRMSVGFVLASGGPVLVLISGIFFFRSFYRYRLSVSSNSKTIEKARARGIVNVVDRERQIRANYNLIESKLAELKARKEYLQDEIDRIHYEQRQNEQTGNQE